MSLIERPPIVAVMGHVDHGKSTLLDYIRNTNVVEGEAGGITQSVSAYEVEHNDPNRPGETKRITFIDTPGHAAFMGMRKRGATIADIAILIVSAEDSVKAQTEEAIRIIKDNSVPFVVAINKVDLPNANVEKVKSDLMMHEIYLEGYGGDVPYTEISAKKGTGVDTLLELILILAELHEFKGDPNVQAEGYVVESHLDSQRGVSATLIIKNGTLHRGDTVVSGCGMASTRILEDFMGSRLEEATFSSPIIVTGFSTQCSAGSQFYSFKDKKEAEAFIADTKVESYVTTVPDDLDIAKTHIIPIVLKTDVEGMIEAIAPQIEALSSKGIFFKIIKSGVGNINESDVIIGCKDDGVIILGFNVSEDPKIKSLNEYEKVTIQSFNIIYKMTEWLESQKDTLRYKESVDRVTGEAKILKLFSSKRGEFLLGGTVVQGELNKKDKFKIVRDGIVVGNVKIGSLQQARSTVDRVLQDTEFGAMVMADFDLIEGDILQAYISEII